MGRPKKNDVVNTVKKKDDEFDFTVELTDDEIVESVVSKKIYKDKNPNLMEIDLVRIEKVVYKNMILGRSTLKIRELLRDEYMMTDRAVIYAMLKKVSNKILGSVKEDLDIIKSKMIDQYSEIYYRALEKDDLRTALSTLDSMTKLYGLIQQRVEINTGTVYKVEF